MNKQQLASTIWESANQMRSKIEANEYKDFILGFIFYKYLSERELELFRKEKLSDEEIRKVDESDVEYAKHVRETLGYFISYNNLFSTWLEKGSDFDIKDVRDALSDFDRNIDEVYNKVFAKIFNTLQTGMSKLGETSGAQTKSVKKLLRLIKKIPMDGKQDYDVLGFIYEYLISNFAANAGKKAGEFYTPHEVSVLMSEIVAEHLKDKKQIKIYDPACGSGGMFVQTGDFVNQKGLQANNTMTFYGQEKVEYNAQLCLMNMAVHGLTGVIKSGDDANTFYHDAHNLAGSCNYVMANPPFNVDKVKAESAQAAGRLPFGIPGVNKAGEFGNANYLWISYFYAYLNETGRAGFVMASSATDSAGKDKNIREKLVQTGNVDVMISVGNNFFYTKSLPCTLWFFDRGKKEKVKGKTLFIDARNYYTVVDRTLNEWTDWQIKNLTAIVWLYRGETEKYAALLNEYRDALQKYANEAESTDPIKAAVTEDFSTTVDNLKKYQSSPYLCVNCLQV